MPADDPPKRELVDWLALARQLAAGASFVRSQLAVAGVTPFSETEQLVLWHCSLGPAEGLGQSELVAAMGCSPAQISSTVEALRKAGQLRARRSPQDRRRQLWSLTTAGAATVVQWQPVQAQALAELRSRLPGQARATLSELLAWLEGERNTSGDDASSSQRGEAA